MLGEALDRALEQQGHHVLVKGAQRRCRSACRFQDKVPSSSGIEAYRAEYVVKLKKSKRSAAGAGVPDRVSSGARSSDRTTPLPRPEFRTTVKRRATLREWPFS